MTPIERALWLAIDVIENYEMEIREANLADSGFCQGWFFKNALAHIQREKEGIHTGRVPVQITEESRRLWEET